MPYARSKSRPSRAGATRNASPQGLAFLVLGLALLLLGWRALTVLTAPAQNQINPAFTAAAETITGPDKLRVVEGDNGQLLILIDGPEGALASADATKLRQLAETLYPNAPPATIRQYPFAKGTPANPKTADLAELGVLMVLVLLAGGLIFRISSSAKPDFEADTTLSHHPRARAVPVNQTPALSAVPVKRSASPQSPVEKATDLAQKNPEATAAIIRKWLRQEESRA